MIENRQIAVLSFYSFTTIDDLQYIHPRILLAGDKCAVKGTVLIAHEGFNGSVSGSLEQVKALVDKVIELTGAVDVNIKINYCYKHPFQKLKVKIKNEIIAMNVGELDINKLKGQYVETKDWDKFIARDDVVLIDTRNDNEVAEGSFAKALDPSTANFKQFPNWVEQNKQLLEGKKIAMFCTGGIRCEKSTAYLSTLGFKDVYHLRGGILQYLEDTANNAQAWHGTCVVFDDRRAVDQDLKPVVAGL
jgi:UPF0176 protein